MFSRNLSDCRVVERDGMDHDSLNESLLEKLKAYSQKPNESMEGLRSVAAKLHNRATSQDKHIKYKTLERIWKKNEGGLTLILYMLETVRDPFTANNLAGILYECVITKTPGKNKSPAISQLIHMNATHSLIKHLNHLQAKDSSVNDGLVQELILILSQLAQRDAKFSLKARLLGAVKTFHYFLRHFVNHAKLLFPILQIIKALSRNTTTAGALAKDGVMTTMEKVVSTVGVTPSNKLRIALNILTYLSKNKLCCNRIIQSTLLPMILRVLERWERYDGKLRLKICYYCLVTLQRVCYLKLGRKAIKSNSGLQILYKFCHTVPEDKTFDPILTRACGVVNFCLERRSLPLDDISGPGKFPLPNISNSSFEKSSYSLRDVTPDFDEGDSEDELLEDDEDGVAQLQGIDPDDAKVSPGPTMDRPAEDLTKEYSKFCPEYNKTQTNAQNNEWTQTISQTQVYKERYPLTVHDMYLNSKSNKSVSSDSDSLYSSGNTSSHLSDMSDCLKRNPSSTKRMHNGALTRSYNKDNMLLMRVLKNVHGEHGMQRAFSLIASQVNSVIPFVKVAYPDFVGGDGIGALEPLNTKERKVCRQKLLLSLERSMHPSENTTYNVVYDLDNLITTQRGSYNKENRELFNDDEFNMGEKFTDKSYLEFESRFESGNLRKAVQIGPREYDLILNSDVNSDKHHHWFYFQVSNMDDIAPYQFNIVNFEKLNSQFNYGMKPLMYSVHEAVLGRPGWVRTGTDICYYRNSYQKMTGQQKCYYTTTFSIHFRHNKDICYIAYHFPYTYTQLLRQIWKWTHKNDYNKIYFKSESLCDSLNQNQVPLLTITATPTDTNPFHCRETMFLSARVHPGESNASWIMLGTLDYLLGNSQQAVSLRNKYIFKVIPMLNIEGVINGCNRCGLSNEDLNRRWKNPNPILHPEIYHAKGLLEYCCKVIKKPPFLFCDFHGHSRKKNVFLYGCANNESWAEVDRQIFVSPVEYLLIAHLMKHFCPAFSFNSCKFRVERSREATARVAVWRDFGIKRSYTMESSFCGCDQGIYAGYHLDTKHLKEVGAQFCEVLSCLYDETTWRLELMLENQESAANYELKSPSESAEKTRKYSTDDLHRAYL